jgi:2-polyprenyl-3-methyl-5-hydroxy-6-metoxy-1,4-benzoquinol methylase
LEQAIDTGTSTLEVISKADRFNKWMYDTVSPFLHGNILEIGSGIGNISKFFIAQQKPISLSDTNPAYVVELKKSFDASPFVKDIVSIDLADPEFKRKYADNKNRYDSVFLLNVLEHIENDDESVKNLGFLLKKGGVLLVLVPAYNWLFSKMDTALGHHRRYTAGRLSVLLDRNEFTVQKKFYFNSLGIAAWLYGKVLKHEAIRDTEMNTFDKLVGIAKLADKVLLRSIGLSAIVVATKQ